MIGMILIGSGGLQGQRCPQKRLYTRAKLTCNFHVWLKYLPFIVIGWDPWTNERVNYLSCIKGKGGFERHSLSFTECQAICWSIIKYFCVFIHNAIVNMIHIYISLINKLLGVTKGKIPNYPFYSASSVEK